MRNSSRLFTHSRPWFPPRCFTGVPRLDDQIFINRNPGVPSVVKFHPFNTCIAVADKDSIWSETENTAHSSFSLMRFKCEKTPWFALCPNVLSVTVSGTGRKASGWTTSTTETLVTRASRPWSTWTDTTVRYCSLRQVWNTHSHGKVKIKSAQITARLICSSNER